MYDQDLEYSEQTLKFSPDNNGQHWTDWIEIGIDILDPIIDIFHPKGGGGSNPKPSGGGLPPIQHEFKPNAFAWILIGVVVLMVFKPFGRKR